MAFIQMVSNEPGTIELGVQGENKAEGVAFDITQWIENYGTGTAYIYHRRNIDAAPYLKELTIDTSEEIKKAIWIFDDADTAAEGEGACQLVYVKDDVIKKTMTYRTNTGESLGDGSGETPDPYEDLLGAARAIYQSCRDEANAATAKAGEAAQHEADAEAAKIAAEAAAEAAENSAQSARDTFEIAGDTSFSVNSVTNKVTMHFTISE